MAISTGEIGGSATERVLYGTPAAQAVLREVQRLASERVFLLVSTHLARHTQEIARIEQALGKRCAAVQSGIRPHAPQADVLRAVRAARAVQADLIVTVGGGSVTDAGKIVTLCLKHDVATDDQLERLRVRYDANGSAISAPYAGPDVRSVSVPTTLSGGEFNSLSGAYDERQRRKFGYDHRLMAPVAVILDPEITVHTPQWLWLSTGVRAVDHAVETLVSTFSNDYSNGLARSALSLLGEALPRVKADSTDLQARLKCQMGAWQSMQPMLSGVPMGASHAIGHILGAVSNVPHGYTSCVMCPAVQRWNSEVVADQQRDISALLGRAGAPADVVLDELIRGLGLPRTLQEVGVAESDLQAIAEGTLHDIWGGTNPRPIRDAADVMQILQLAFAATPAGRQGEARS